MQIHLKQLEIVAALKMYITRQGINLAGKTVEIAFTSGRKDNGLSAEVSIEDAVVPASIGSCMVHSTAPHDQGYLASGNHNCTSERNSIEEIPNKPVEPVAKPVSLFKS